ncbi:HNH endonuclease [Mycobacteroides abscessus]|uniref:HNH endonuclease n=2 Tax=Mycobacteroides abscessus TaxID=36809 RepID=UPI0009A86CC5|nr:HNH endonuclease signature motif containing protein [Mycobacteroides abscessus]
MPPAATATRVVTTTPDGAEDGHTSSTKPGASASAAVNGTATNDEPLMSQLAPRSGPSDNQGAGPTPSKEISHMPRAPRVCSEADCIQLAYHPQRYCPQHQTSGWARSPRTASSRHASTAEWKRTRVRILRRDNNTCRIQGPRCTTQATAVDHIKPVSLGGTDDPNNLQSACHACHTWKTAQEGARAR